MECASILSTVMCLFFCLYLYPHFLSVSIVILVICLSPSLSLFSVSILTVIFCLSPYRDGDRKKIKIEMETDRRWASSHSAKDRPNQSQWCVLQYLQPQFASFSVCLNLYPYFLSVSIIILIICLSPSLSLLCVCLCLDPHFLSVSI